MIKVLKTNDIREADRYTIEHEPVSSIDMMERAGTKAFEIIWKDIIKQSKIHHFSVFCGVGDNGGDGLVISRKLADIKISHQVYILETSERYTDDCKENLERYKELGLDVIVLTTENYEFELQENSIIIDSIFGIGLNREIEGFAAEVIQKLNASSNKTIALDIPTGLFTENNKDRNFDNIIKADYTFSFQFPKLTFFFPDTAKYIGKWELIDVRIHQDFIRDVDAIAYYMQTRDFPQMLPPRRDFAHKGTFGHALLLAGSKGKVGAAVLAGRACLRSGIGLLSIQAPKVAYQILQTSIPEAIVIEDEGNNFLTEFNLKQNFSAIGIGPGIGQNEQTQNMLKLLIQAVDSPLVLDADALNILAENKTWLSFLPINSILTPHPGELRRLIGDWGNDYQRFQMLKEFAVKHKVCVVLKDHYTTIATPSGEMYFNSTGNSGMATGGSGDVLTGIITSFLAQGLASQEAALLGVYLHGLAGDIAAKEIGERSLLPSDIVDCLGKAFNVIEPVR